MIMVPQQERAAGAGACPFCRNPGWHFLTTIMRPPLAKVPEAYCVECYQCAARGPLVVAYEEDAKGKAVARWNSRGGEAPPG